MTNQLKTRMLALITEMLPLTKDERLTDELRQLRLEITNDLPYFKITSVSRDDLTANGLIADNVDDDTMEQLASKMADDYCEQLFHSSLQIIAEDYFKIPTWYSVRGRLLNFCTDILDQTIDGDERARITFAENVLKSMGADDDSVGDIPANITENFDKAFDCLERSINDFNDPSVATDYLPLVAQLKSFIHANTY